MTAAVMTLDRFLDKEQKGEVIEAREGKVSEFMVRWNLTRTNLTDKWGRILKNTVITKAMKFVELDCCRKKLAEPLGDGVARETWVVDPIPGYNITAYTVIIEDYGSEIVAMCNCQWCCSRESMCSHILAVLVESERTALKRTIRPLLREPRLKPQFVQIVQDNAEYRAADKAMNGVV